jgi:hypothetical protein
MKEAKRRLEKKVKKELVKPHREPKPHKIRKTYNTVVPEPYAPQLIRLRRSPYALDIGYFRKSKGGERAKLEPKLRERPNVGALVQAARRAPRLALPKPSECRMRVETRSRMSVDSWLSGGER